MRCAACDDSLSDKESRSKFLYSGKYTDLCTKCLDTIRDVAPTQDDDVRQAPKDVEQEPTDASWDEFDR
jgi:hypothetical protein